MTRIYGETPTLLRLLALAVGRTRFLISVCARPSSRRRCGFGKLKKPFFVVMVLICYVSCEF